ncbi:chloramphenicol O-acetyltransferase type A [Pedobacter cryoconitis]|uniref:Chloramphenicol O-acetyltransferase type A n=1 Tax=Pedobacter cryoconitis TaxID=188932 RepID=A0A7W9E0C6_9SPHI|nr:chloramphenicol acetyltransferase [Pedobacter cryoconitis]MBB5637149.1 chloramphenicol O-acetyltransferase type A [Pedobacter cryoconitis]MBB6273916.1 chloramphenicol O-acetyltransferase type A [Pedobacter cryoconitis]
MEKELDIDQWKRKEHFHFFRKFEEPFFGVTVNIDCTKAYAHAKQSGKSFFLYYLYQSLKAANTIEEFRYRIKADKVIIHDQVDASATIGRPDETFGFSYIEFNEDFEQFYILAQQEADRVSKGTGLFPAILGESVIHYSALPWLDFSALSHARSFSFEDSSPKISFSKLITADNKKTMNVSIHVNHALMDGYHVGKFVEKFQELMNQ